MSMVTLIGALRNPDGTPSEELIEFKLSEDLLEMVIDEKYYFQIEGSGYWSQLAINGKVYVDIKRKPAKPYTMI